MKEKIIIFDGLLLEIIFTNSEYPDEMPHCTESGSAMFAKKKATCEDSGQT